MASYGVYKVTIRNARHVLSGRVSGLSFFAPINRSTLMLMQDMQTVLLRKVKKRRRQLPV
jgi:CelD/BcsL family acetyltransferase involved in cellulose biosynthesis